MGVVESPFLEVFRIHVVMVLRDMVQWWDEVGQVGSWIDDHECFLFFFSNLLLYDSKVHNVLIAKWNGYSYNMKSELLLWTIWFMFKVISSSQPQSQWRTVELPWFCSQSHFLCVCVCVCFKPNVLRFDWKQNCFQCTNTKVGKIWRV